MGRLDGKVAIVTGSGRGIGKAIAVRFAMEGANVVVNAITPSHMEATVAEITRSGHKAIAAKADVSQKNEVERLVTAAIGAFKKVDILVNNAGVTCHAPLLEVTEADWDRVLATDLKGVFMCTQAIAKHMMQNKYGKIINLTSVAGIGSVQSYMASYGAAKGGVVNFTKVAAVALGSHGINVNAIAPGSIATELIHDRRSPAEFEAYMGRIIGSTALGRLGTVEDIANLAVFLASDESSFITGQVISCDGGRRDKL